MQVPSAFPHPIDSHRITHRPMINFHLCGKCGTCASLCRRQAINHQHNGNYEVFIEFCIGCGVCARVCPNGAIEMMEIGGITALG
jgi:2-oxoacid:acceptor oxidoreductase delta subunit (pyruvate/2-ketoisovalerate family)